MIMSNLFDILFLLLDSMLIHAQSESVRLIDEQRTRSYLYLSIYLCIGISLAIANNIHTKCANALQVDGAHLK